MIQEILDDLEVNHKIIKELFKRMTLFLKKVSDSFSSRCICPATIGALHRCIFLPAVASSVDRVQGSYITSIDYNEPWARTLMNVNLLYFVIRTVK